MDCLGSCKARNDIEFEFIQPSAPTYYAIQPPYNPSYLDQFNGFDDVYDHGPSHAGSRILQSDNVDHEYTEELKQWRCEPRSRRLSVYEGVQWTPVSGSNDA